MNFLAETETAAGSAGWAISIVVGILSGLVGALVLVNLHSLKACVSKVLARMDQQDAKIKDATDKADAVAKSLLTCKIDCDRQNVSKEDFVREAGYSRRLQEEQIREMAEIKARLDIIHQLPAIMANITRSIIEEINRGNKHGKPAE